MKKNQTNNFKQNVKPNKKKTKIYHMQKREKDNHEIAQELL